MMLKPWLAFLFTTLLAAAAGAALAPTGLKCGFCQDPLGVDEAWPRLSWQMRATPPGQGGQAQTAYQIMVASTTNLLAANNGDLWDSGKVRSDSSLGIAYAGFPLASAQQVWWKVRVWDRSGKRSEWSSTATWTMGLLNPADWRGAWLGAPTNSSLPMFRREFVVRPGLQRALVFICGLGQYEVSANGAKVGDALLSPGWTKYNKTCLYDTLDLTACLKTGANALGVMLGNGMYQVPPGPRYKKFTGSFGPPKLIVQVHLSYADGTREIIATDPQWRTAPGPITFSSVYGGEDFDARRWPPGWNQPGFDDSSWQPAMSLSGPGGDLRGLSCAAPPVRAFEMHAPIASWTLTNGDMVFDLGQNAAHVPQVTVRGPADSRVWIFPGELTNLDGSVSQGSMGANPPGLIRCEYTKATDGVEAWSPRFFYAGCRYAQARLFPATPLGALPVIQSFGAVVVRSSAQPVGEFECSNELFDRIHVLVRWAQRANLMSVLTDCPHRERLGWLEEYHLNGPSLRYEFDLAQFFTKGMNDMADSQLANGLVPDIAPEYTVFKDGFRDSPEWGSAFVIVPWQQYQFTGDGELLRRHYEGMKRYVAFLDGKATNHILAYGLGDWYDLGPRPPGLAQLTPVALTATAFYYYDTWILAHTAALLDRPTEAVEFTKQAGVIRAAFNREFFNPATRAYTTGSQCANAIPLALQLCDPTNRVAVLDALVADVRRQGNALTAGDVGYRFLLRALAENGRSDVIFAMNNQSERPGYGYQLKMGATSLTEAWNARRESSQNHFMLGQINEWFYHDLAGIQCDPTGPGFKKIIIRPAFVGDLAWVNCTYQSAYGLIVSHWRRDGRQLALDVTIPPNTTATIYVPGKAVQTRGAKLSRVENGLSVFAVGPGDYHFVTKTAPESL